MKQATMTAAALLSGVLALGSGAADPVPAKAETQKVVSGNTEFALGLYGRLRDREGNLFCSPFSISTALAMTSAGARGRTLDQMASTLHLPEQKALHPALGNLLRQVNGEGKQRGYQLNTANALWGQKGFDFLKDFLALNKAHYGAGLNEVDFAGDTEKARRTINAWVEKETKDKIKELLKKGVLTADTRLVLTNAIYFKGDWDRQFKKDRTRQGDFTLASGKKVKAPLMSQETRYGYYEEPTFQALEMMYAGKELSMVVLLPRKADGLPALEKQLTPTNLSRWLGKMRTTEVNVTFPRFKMTSEFQLNDVLRDMGMTDAFERGVADFSGIDGTRKLFISAVVHKAFVEVNEQGTEAAAATGVVVTTTSARITPEFRADRPFVFLLRDKRNNSVLFLGRVSDPS